MAPRCCVDFFQDSTYNTIVEGDKRMVGLSVLFWITSYNHRHSTAGDAVFSGGNLTKIFFSAWSPRWKGSGNGGAIWHWKEKFPHQNLSQLLLSLVSLLEQLLQQVTESCALLHQNLLHTHTHAVRESDDTHSSVNPVERLQNESGSEIINTMSMSISNTLRSWLFSSPSVCAVINSCCHGAMTWYDIVIVKKKKEIR